MGADADLQRQESGCAFCAEAQSLSPGADLSILWRTIQKARSCDILHYESK